MAMQLEARRPGTAGRGSEPSPKVSGGGRGVDAVSDIGASIAEAVHRLSRLGYVRTFEPAGTALWCRSSETSFDPAELVVESVTRIDGVTVLALRDTRSGTAGTWLLLEWTGREQRLLAQLSWPRSARPSRGQPDHRRERAGPPSEPVLDLTA